MWNYPKSGLFNIIAVCSCIHLSQELPLFFLFPTLPALSWGTPLPSSPSIGWKREGRGGEREKIGENEGEGRRERERERERETRREGGQME